MDPSSPQPLTQNLALLGTPTYDPVPGLVRRVAPTTQVPVPRHTLAQLQIEWLLLNTNLQSLVSKEPVTFDPSRPIVRWTLSRSSKAWQQDVIQLHQLLPFDEILLVP